MSEELIRFQLSYCGCILLFLNGFKKNLFFFKLQGLGDELPLAKAKQYTFKICIKSKFINFM